MRDIWGFLMQTLTASGVAVLLLVIKAMFRDKLSPKWQFAVWGVLGCVLLIPAGTFGRYVLVNWQAAVETLKTLLTGEYTLTQVILPFPLPVTKLPANAAEWIFVIYELGVLVFLMKYLVSYVRLGSVLRKRENESEGAGTDNNYKEAEKVRDTAEKYRLPVCPVVPVAGIHSAFIFGIFRPVLVLPAGEMPDEKVILHELLHLKSKDTLWGVLICIFRCIHWCNPLLWHCADLAGNDIEARCDYRVLELLEGEERRDYGRILLSMANEKYARMPGTSSMANGGRNISRRIESIVRFKKYPAGMALVSVCIVMVLAFPVLAGTKAEVYTEKWSEGYTGADTGNIMTAYAMASARTRWCTTPAGALDTYGKSLLKENGIYRAMCAPLAMQEDIAEEMKNSSGWSSELGGTANAERGYYVYNLESLDSDRYTTVMIIPLLNAAEDAERGGDMSSAEKLSYGDDLSSAEALSGGKNLYPEEGKLLAAVQQVRVEREGSRWVVTPLDTTEIVETSDMAPEWGSRAFPSYLYTATAADFRVDIQYQQSFAVDNTIVNDGQQSLFFGNTVTFDTVPKPDAEFARVYQSSLVTCTYIGDDAGKADITELGITAVPMDDPENRPELPSVSNGFYSSSDGTISNSGYLDGETDWDPVIDMGGSGGTAVYEKPANKLPACFAAELYINGEPVAELTLERVREK